VFDLFRGAPPAQRDEADHPPTGAIATYAMYASTDPLAQPNHASSALVRPTRRLPPSAQTARCAGYFALSHY
jgi:hypothetical protein